MATPASLRALLHSCIDYAGTFPPARLALEQAVENYFRHRREPESWMLSRFACPADSLPVLSGLLEAWDDAAPCPVSAICRGGATAASFVDQAREDLRLVEAFAASRQARIESLEFRLPVETLSPENPEPLRRLVGLLHSLLDAANVGVCEVFLEIALAEAWQRSVPGVCEVLAERNRSAATHGTPRFGVKLRTGGLQPADFPTPEQLALVVTACERAALRWKATAGLHQALWHRDDSTGAGAFGFLSLLASAALAHAHRLDRDEVQRILQEEDAHAFEFHGGFLAWRGLRATTEQVADARRHALRSFGSCSFDEPRECLYVLHAKTSRHL
jgi:hypothetical protein